MKINFSNNSWYRSLPTGKLTNFCNKYVGCVFYTTYNCNLFVGKDKNSIFVQIDNSRGDIEGVPLELFVFYRVKIKSPNLRKFKKYKNKFIKKDNLFIKRKKQTEKFFLFV